MLFVSEEKYGNSTQLNFFLISLKKSFVRPGWGQVILNRIQMCPFCHYRICLYENDQPNNHKVWSQYSHLKYLSCQNINPFDMWPFATQFGSKFDYQFSEIFPVWVLTHMRVGLGWPLIRVGRTLRRLGLRARKSWGCHLPLHRNRAIVAAPSRVTNACIDVGTFLNMSLCVLSFMFHRLPHWHCTPPTFPHVVEYFVGILYR